jgi:O-antigen biosynthesis protein
LHLGWTARHLVGASPAELVELCHELLTDPVLWAEVQEGLLEICRTRFSPTEFRRSMRDVLAACAIPPPGSVP